MAPWKKKEKVDNKDLLESLKSGDEDGAIPSGFWGTVRNKCRLIYYIFMFGLPEPLRKLFLKKITSNDGKVLDSQVQCLLEVVRYNPKYNFFDIIAKDLAKARRIFTKMAKRQTKHKKVHIENSLIGSQSNPIPIRIYTPKALKDQKEGNLKPVLVYFHGGGWIIGSIDTVDGLLSWLAHSSSCVIVSVDYRLSPEHKFPAGVEDAITSFKWVVETAPGHGWDIHRIAVGGDSAGGNLAAVLAQQAVIQRFSIKPCLQFLLFPALHLGEDKSDFPSISEFGLEPFYLLPYKSMAYCKQAYLENVADAERDIRISPILAKASTLKQLPSAYFGLCHFDVLRDEGKKYAKDLQKNNVSVVVDDFCAHHGFIYNYAQLGYAKRCLLKMGKFLRDYMYISN